MEDFLKAFHRRARLIKEQYPSFEMWSDSHALMMYQSIQEHQLIREFINPVDPNKVIQLIKNKFNYKAFTQPSKNSEFVFIEVPTFLSFIEDLIKQMEIYNYYPSMYYINYKEYKKIPPQQDLEATKKTNSKLTIQFEPYRDTKITPNQKLYHLTPDFNWKKIRTLGLTPKTQSKIANHPGRIYLINHLDPNDFEELAIALWDKNPNKDIIRDMDLLEIDSNKLRNYKFYEDPNFYFGENGEAVYTYENIPPFAIKHIKSILVNPRVKDRK